MVMNIVKECMVWNTIIIKRQRLLNIAIIKKMTHFKILQQIIKKINSKTEQR